MLRFFVSQTSINLNPMPISTVDYFSLNVWQGSFPIKVADVVRAEKEDGDSGGRALFGPAVEGLFFPWAVPQYILGLWY